VSSAASVTYWIDQLKAGDQAAAQPLWEGYFQQLVMRTRQKLAGMPRRAADEEDVALSAFASFCRAAAQGRFPKLNDRDDLWQLLIVITDRKAHRLVQYERRQRRGGGQVLDEAALAPDRGTEPFPLAQVAGREPSPDFAVQVGEECRRLLAALDDPDLQRAAVLKMEGYTVADIAARMGCVPRTVKRWLQLIRQTWEQSSTHDRGDVDGEPGVALAAGATSQRHM
jgi:DNA-directed RNA polymerase specialized sigma24 family protein